MYRVNNPAYFCSVFEISAKDVLLLPG